MINLTVTCDKCGNKCDYESPMFPIMSGISIVNDIDGFIHDEKENKEYCQECINKNKKEPSTTIKFTGCQYLDYSDNYESSAKKQKFNVNGETKVFWLKENSSLPMMVQFCPRNGLSLNEPHLCLRKEDKQCSDYIDCIHIVTVED